MIFIDSNIPMYLVGAEHSNKARVRRSLTRAIEDEKRLITSAEVVQEILHRYVAIARRAAIQPALDVLLHVVDDVIDVTLADGLRARDIVLANESMTARDALHLAVMEREGITEIMSLDRDFDRWPGVRRIG